MRFAVRSLIAFAAGVSLFSIVDALSGRYVHAMAGMIWASYQGRKTDIWSTFAPMDPSDIPARLQRAGRSQADLARYLKLDPSSLTKTIRGVRQLKAAEMLAIEDFLAAPGQERTRPRSRQPFSKRIPIYGYAAAGGEDRVVMNDGQVIDWAEPPPFWNGAGEIFGVRVVGTSMEPRLFQGEVVFAQFGLPPHRDQDCIVEFPDGAAIVKTFRQERDGTIVCHQWNPDKDLAIKRSVVKSLHTVIWRR